MKAVVVERPGEVRVAEVPGEVRVAEVPGEVRVAEVPDPEVGPKDVLVRVGACGTCGTDIHIIDGEFRNSEGLFWAKLAASSTMAVLPIILLGWVAQRQRVRGLSLGVVK